jgi:large subunit ribosomal protein L18|tara:strand:- start:11062 stop:11433 length:372 start_codon:yes stop_codon:yes gene_type:complete|mmetsp:Transcript_5559/g.21015  ORF Transcript_5559/g.21015 Transcript_5559/m.21015 type:complete len:124 (-) Transcript_5559:133-504(-)
MTDKERRRQKRHTKIRSKVSGTAERPRISVYRSNQHTYVQVIDDENQTTLCAVGTMSVSIKEKVGKEEWATKTVTAANEVGKALGAMCVEKGIKKAVFDRGGFVYHGRVKAVAEGCREAGVEF